MRDSDQDIVRRALSSVLDRLERGARPESEITASANQSARDQYAESRMNNDAARDNSIIVIFLGQSNATADGVDSFGAKQGEPGKEMRESLAPGDVERRFAFDARSAQAAHPGLEKFPIAESQTEPAAPKTCFMEPGRVCVNSGACEMRGY